MNRKITLLFLFISSLLNAQNYSLHFDGVDDAVEIPATLDFVPDQFTIEGWIKISSTGIVHPIFSKYNTSNNNTASYTFTIREDNKLALGVYQSNSNYRVAFTDSPVIVTNTWQHVAVTFDLNTQVIALYVNGNPVASSIISGSSNITSISTDLEYPITIGNVTGASGNTINFSGHIDELRFWNVARTGNELSNNSNTELTGTEAGLIAYYKMDNSNSTCDIFDCNTNENHGLRIGEGGTNNLPQVTTDTPPINNVPCGAPLTNCTIPTQYVYIPDANFKSYLVGNTAINTNGDMEISFAEAAAFNGALDVSNLGIVNLTGIETFTALTQLQCGRNQLTSIDLSMNTALTLFDCYDNQLTSIDISQNTALTLFRCSDNQLSTVDISKNTDLYVFRCSENQLTNIDVSNNPLLEVIFCYNNQITALDLSNNPKLKQLRCNLNQLTSLEVSNNPALTELDCNVNQIASLDLSNHTALASLRCEKNQLSTLDLSNNPALTTMICFDNQLASLNMVNGNNTALSNAKFDAKNNSNLTCIEVDDAAWSTANWTNIDSQTSFSEDCAAGPCIVSIPDANFKAYLIGAPSINTNGDNEIQCSEATAYTSGIQIGGLNVSDLTGIEAFTEINLLSCQNNSIATIDLSSNTKIETLIAFKAGATQLILGNNLVLSNIRCDDNYNISSIDLSGLPNLEMLNVRQNKLTTLDLSNNLKLTSLFCGQNLFTDLDLSHLPLLLELICYFNQLTSLNVANGNNTNFLVFESTNNPNLACIEVDDAAWSTANWTTIDPASSFSTDCTTTSVRDQSLSSISIFPNPSNSILNLDFPDGKVPRVDIINYTGKIIRSITSGTAIIDVSQLTDGIYFLTIKTDRGIVHRRFVKTSN